MPIVDVVERKRQSTSERRLAQVRALKERYFSEELTVEERLRAKDAQIVLLENQVADLRRRLEKLERTTATSTASEARATRRPLPERQATTANPDSISIETDDSA